MAIAVLMDRIDRLKAADRNDLFDLILALKDAEDPEDVASIRRAMEEILAQRPITATALPLGEGKPLTSTLDRWARQVGKKIRELRELAGMNQTQLAKKAGLTQSHVSRIENAEHSATNFTLEKIARALGVEIEELDPCSD
jgi:ribosome-binding protein aMBF1 (putative translation factor)